MSLFLDNFRFMMVARAQVMNLGSQLLIVGETKSEKSLISGNHSSVTPVVEVQSQKKEHKIDN